MPDHQSHFSKLRLIVGVRDSIKMAMNKISSMGDVAARSSLDNVGSRERNSNKSRDSRRCGCGARIAIKNIARHNLKAHKIVNDEILDSRWHTCPFCRHQVSTKRFDSHIRRVHGKSNAEIKNKIPIEAQSSKLDLQNSTLISLCDILDESKSTESVEDVIRSLYFLAVHRHPFHSFVSDEQSSKLAPLGLKFVHYFDRLPYDFPSRFTSHTSIQESIAFQKELELVMGFKIVKTRRQLLELASSLPENPAAFETNNTTSKAKPNPIASIDQNRKNKYHTATSLTRMLRSLRKQMNINGESTFAKSVQLPDGYGDRNYGIRTRRQEAKNHPLKQKHLWAVLRAEWEIKLRLQKVFLLKTFSQPSTKLCRSNINKAKRLHDLLGILVETLDFSPSLAKQVRQFATVRNKLIHEVGYYEIRNSKAFFKNFVELIIDLDSLVQDMANQTGISQINLRYFASRWFPYARELAFTRCIQTSKQVEGLLATRLSANGKGLKSKLISVKHNAASFN
ncbi:MAG: hypothetical protein R3C03_17635 [Pirellulaceae bacterium]